MEEWADLNNFPNHQISSLAGVRKGQRFHGCHIEYVKNKEVIIK